ncbi:MAG TPA: ABC transporter ATP-binding protein [Lachnospiraceae bacterium]|nr:ABC transporter ATP-binding protein [Lachnospiraceae bacterium]
MNDAVVLHTADLCVGYKNMPVLSELNLKAERGKLLTLIGPNGSGKSTVLKSIAKQLAPLAGTVYLEGAALETLSYSDTAKKAAVVLTKKPHAELMTCFEVAAAGRYPYTGRFGMLTKKDKQIVLEAMRLVDAADLADRQFRKLSDGQKQKILLARALCQEPEILILDEPTSFLDLRHKIDILNVLKETAEKKNLAVVMSLHDLDLARQYSDTVMCVRGEHISHIGTAEEIFRQEIICELFELTRQEYEKYV